MSSIAVSVGIDVSKDALEVCALRESGPKRLSVPNTKEGIEKLIAFLGPECGPVSMEATGRFESLAERSLRQAGYEVKVQNPRLAKRLAEGMGASAKNDRLDAESLASSAPFCKAAHPKSEERERLCDISRAVRALTNSRSGYLKRLKTPGLAPAAAESYRRIAEDLKREISLLKKRFKQEIKETAFFERWKLLQTVKNVGEDAARAAVCELPEDLSLWTPKQIASYAALVPAERSSGKSKSKAELKKHGNMHLKSALYMPAISMIRNDPEARRIYADGLAKGKTHRQAVVPVMHKLFRQIVAVAKRGTAWQPVPPKRC